MAIEKKKVIAIMCFATIVGSALSVPLASPHHHYKEKVSIHAKYKGYYPVGQPVVAYGPSQLIYEGGYGHSGGGYGHLGGGYGNLGGGYGHSGGSVATASASAVASVGAIGGSVASASASSASSYGYGRK